jgi:hypothetical protein
MFRHAIEGRAHLRLICYVQCKRAGAPTLLDDAGSHLFCNVHLYIGDKDLCALCSEEASSRLTDPRASACDERTLPV